MPRSAEDWLILLTERDGRLDRTLLRIVAQVLARTDLPNDVLLIIADALAETVRECIAGGRAIDAIPLQCLRHLLICEAEMRKGSFW